MKKENIWVIALIIVVAAILVVWLVPKNPSDIPGNNPPGTVEIIPSPSSTVSSTSPAVSATSSNPITQADNNQTITVTVGDHVLLSLGSGLNWSVTNISNPAVMHRLTNIAVVKGAQGVYSIDSVGTTTLTATGAPQCDPGNACPMFRVLFTTNIVAVAAK